MKKKLWVAWCVRLGSLALVGAVVGNLASMGTQNEQQQANPAGDAESDNRYYGTSNPEMTTPTPVPSQPSHREDDEHDEDDEDDEHDEHYKRSEEHVIPEQWYSGSDSTFSQGSSIRQGKTHARTGGS